MNFSDPNLNTKIDYQKLLNSYELPKSKDGVIILNPNNPNHVRWMEEEDGEALAQTQGKRAKLWSLAEKNTVRNKDGLTVLTKDSPYRKEKGWESDII